MHRDSGYNSTTENITVATSTLPHSEESTSGEVECARNEMLKWMCRVNKQDRIRNERIRGTAKGGKISKTVQESRLKWYGHILRRRVYGQESDGDVGKEGEEDQSGGGWIASGTTCRRENFQRRTG